jgi:hypothetical protein
MGLREVRAELGFLLNRLDLAAVNIATTVENSEAACSVLLDPAESAETAATGR